MSLQEDSEQYYKAWEDLKKAFRVWVHTNIPFKWSLIYWVVWILGMIIALLILNNER